MLMAANGKQGIESGQKSSSLESYWRTIFIADPLSYLVRDPQFFNGTGPHVSNTNLES